MIFKRPWRTNELELSHSKGNQRRIIWPLLSLFIFSARTWKAGRIFKHCAASYLSREWPAKLFCSKQIIGDIQDILWSGSYLQYIWRPCQVWHVKTSSQSGLTHRKHPEILVKKIQVIRRLGEVRGCVRLGYMKGEGPVPNFFAIRGIEWPVFASICEHSRTASFFCEHKQWSNLSCEQRALQ